MLKRVVPLASLVLFSVLAVTGCGDSDKRAHHVKGKVTFGGNPVAAGSVQFIPAKGNSGPSGYAEIVNGEFDTSKSGNKGTVGGKHMVVIQAFDGKADPQAELPMGKRLREEYRTIYEIPAEEMTTKNFEIKTEGEASLQNLGGKPGESVQR